MAASSEDSDSDDFVTLGTPVPEVVEGEPLKKPTTQADLTARDKQGRRRFHGAFTGGFSAGYFNTVGTKEGFTPSDFVSSRSGKNDRTQFRPEDFMDEEDLEEHGIAPRKFATVGSFTSEERKRKRNDDFQHLTASSTLNIAPAVAHLIVPEQLPIGVKLLRKMGWREGQGLGPRLARKKKKKKKSAAKSGSGIKVYGCALPPSESEDSDSDNFVPEDMSSITFAPKDVAPIQVAAKDNVHGLGYHGLDPSLALPGSHISLFDTPPVRSRTGGKGIRGQAFGVGAFEEEDEDIYAVDNMSNYDLTMQLDDEGDNKFGWTAPRQHGKQAVPVSYVGKLLEGFKLSSKQLKLKKKFPPPTLPRQFKPQHWFRKRRETSHLPQDVVGEDQTGTQAGKLSAVDRGLMLGETPVMSSVFDLIPKEDKNRIDATKEAIAMSQSLSSKAGLQLSTKFQSAQESHTATTGSAQVPGTDQVKDTFQAKFRPAVTTPVESSHSMTHVPEGSHEKTPLFQGGLSFQPFRKDPAKQARYDKYLHCVKQGHHDPYGAVESNNMTEWEKSRERDEFAKAAKIFRPLSAMMSTRFVQGAMIDDNKVEGPQDTEANKSDQAKAAEMKMFGKLTREEFEWHPDNLLCRRFNVPNPYPGSDIVGLPTVKRDKFSVFNFLNFGDYQQGEIQEPSPVAASKEPEPPQKVLNSVRSKRAAMASVFKVLDDPDFHKQPLAAGKATDTTVDSSMETQQQSQDGKEEKEKDENEPPDQDLFRAIFKNSDSESSSDESSEEKKKAVSSEEEEERKDRSDNDEDDVKDVVMRPLSEDDVHDAKEKVNTPGTDATVRGQAHVPDEETGNQSMKKSPERSGIRQSNKTSRLRSRWGEKSVFSVLDDLDKDDGSNNNATDKTIAPVDPLSSRLSQEDVHTNTEDDAADQFGPRLPPSLTSGTKVSSDPQTSVHKFTPSRPTHSKSDSDHKKEKSRDRHKDRHSHRREKKKKSKHKKDKKHKKHRKSSKSKKSKRREESSGSEADTESDSEDSDVSDSELLQRLKQAAEHGKLPKI